jgi:diguanylate cyclase
LRILFEHQHLIWIFVGFCLSALGASAYLAAVRLRARTARQASEAARIDPLTGLASRAEFDIELRERVRQRRPGQHFAIVAMEIVNVDAIVQQFGRSAGDAVIQAVGNRLSEAKRPGVFLGRTDSAQYCGMGVVLDRQDTMDRARRLHTVLSRDLLIEGRLIDVEVKIGGAVFPADADDAETLMRKTKVALARAIADPLETTVLYDERMDVETRRRLALANSLRGALSRGEFELFSQPQVWIADRHVIGYEALLRWNHPEFGLISPAEFIPLAEKTGAIVPIGLWTLRTACKEAASWGNAARVAVNVSPLQLRQRDLPDRIAETLTWSGLEPDRLEIEVTESLLIADGDKAMGLLHQIKALGVRVALDDFGAGYSSMNVLRQFPFDKVKLDKSLIDDIETDRRARAILHAMMELGRQLSIPILVEGVESERQMMILRNEGCNKVQGYLTGRPMPRSAIGAKAFRASA